MDADVPRRGLHVISSRNKRATFATAAEILGRIEAKGTDIAEQTHGSSTILCADGLGTILNHEQIMLLRDRQDLVHSRRLAKEVNDNDAFRLGSDGSRDLCRIEIEGPSSISTKRGVAPT